MFVHTLLFFAYSKNIFPYIGKIFDKKECFYEYKIHKQIILPKTAATTNPYNVFYNNYMNTNATTECTGLGYRMPDNSEEWNACREVFDFLPVPFPDSEDTKQQ